jgi:hypothetical protein
MAMHPGEQLLAMTTLYILIVPDIGLGSPSGRSYRMDRAGRNKIWGRRREIKSEEGKVKKSWGKKTKRRKSHI